MGLCGGGGVLRYSKAANRVETGIEDGGCGMDLAPTVPQTYSPEYDRDGECRLARNTSGLWLYS